MIGPNCLGSVPWGPNLLGSVQREPNSVRSRLNVLFPQLGSDRTETQVLEVLNANSNRTELDERAVQQFLADQFGQRWSGLFMVRTASEGLHRFDTNWTSVQVPPSTDRVSVPNRTSVRDHGRFGTSCIGRISILYWTQFRVDSTISRSGKLYYFLLAIWSVSMGAQVWTTDHEVLSVGSNPSTWRFLLGKAITE